MKTCPSCGESNAPAAKFCQNCGSALPSAEALPAEQRKLVTVVFCDLTGSTALGESMDPEALRRVITRYFNEMKAVLTSHGGTVEKFIGDAVMAAFGVPLMHEDDALRAVRAAHQMQKVMAEMNQDLEIEYGKSLKARIGVNTGEVIAGDASAGHGFVSGDTVNVGARLEQAAPPGEVLIGDTTYRLVRDAVVVEEVEPLELKGKAERVPAYRLVDVLERVEGTARRLDSVLVGREREMALLTEEYDAAKHEHSCHLVTVFGMAGAGKSRLTQEFMRSVTGDARIVRGRCLPYGEGITFWPIAEAVRDLAEITDEDSKEQAAAKVRSLIPQGEEFDLVAERIAAALGLSDAAISAQETFWSVRRLLEHLAVERPVVAVFDDIHWAEPTMLDLIEYLAGFVQSAPVFILCLARKDLLDSRPTWGTGSKTIMLEPLGDEQVDRLIENLLGAAQLPDAARREIKGAAEGNPLYVEEIVKMLIDDGSLEQVDGKWRPVKDLSKLTIPPTIHALIAARLDHLTGDEKAVIQRGSVVGREFWWGALAHLSTDELRTRLGHFLQALVRKELILPDRSAFAGEDAFRFGHIMIRDAAYGQLPKELRADLHERFAQWLEEKSGERVREYAEILGYHYEQAYRLHEELGRTDDHVTQLGAVAAGLLSDAGRRAFVRADMHAAANLLGRASQLLSPRDRERLEIMLLLADAHMETGDFHKAQETLEQVERAAQALDDQRLVARAKVQMSALRSLTDFDGWKRDVVADVGSLVPVLEAVNDHQGLGRAELLIAEYHWDNHQNAMTEESLHRALAHFSEEGQPADAARVYTWLAASTFWGPTPVDEALKICEDILDRTESQLVVARVDQCIAGLKAMQGAFDDARSLMRKSRRIQSEMGQTVNLATSTHFGGLIELLADDLAAAEAEFRSGYDQLEAMGDEAYLGTQAALLARVLYAQDRFEEAERFVAVSESAAEGDPTLKAEWGPTKARLLARGGDLDAGKTLAAEVIEIAGQGDDVISRGNGLMAMAELGLMSGDIETAARYIEQAALIYETKGIGPWSARARAVLAQLAG